MREIEFRGKNTCDNKWYYGYLDFNKADGRFRIGDGGVSSSIIDTNTIGQYTGLTDKTNTKIFEGDILEWTWGETNEKQIGKVTWHNGGFTFETLHDESHYCNLMQQAKWKYEVIGNIYDNPEFLEVEHDG